MEVLSYVATALVLGAVYFISKPKLRGQFMMLSADATWFVYSVATGQWALAAQSVVLFIIACTAIKNWKREGIKF